MRAYTKKQAAEILQVSTKTLGRDLDEGRLKYFMVGKRRRISETDLRHFMENTECQSSNKKGARLTSTNFRSKANSFEEILDSLRKQRPVKRKFV